MTEKTAKRIPYGISDYEAIQEGNYFYIDKTRYLIEIEKVGKYVFFLRPRRFGKSLLLSMMETYYDIAKKSNFDLFFKGTWVHGNPTEEKNTYLVLKFNFSAVDPGIDRVSDSFLNNVKTTCKSFLNKYWQYLIAAGRVSQDMERLKKDIDEKRSSSDILLNILNLCRDSELKLYILIDEYDNFANTILSTLGSRHYKKLTHGSGFLRSFFNVLKEGTTGSGAPVSRLFVTGVSPITMDDVTSGFNVGKNISGDGKFNPMLGFTLDDVKELIEFYRSEGLIKHETEVLLEIMNRWYNHYRFSKKSETYLFNTDMVLYFLDEYFKEYEIPEELVDDNVRIDYAKLKQLIIIDREDKKGINGNFSQLKKVIKEGIIFSRLKRIISIDRIAHPENFISILFYWGLLTIIGEDRGRLKLGIPNAAMKKLLLSLCGVKLIESQ